MSATKSEANYAYERGKAARRGCRRIGECPYRGNTPKVATLREEWQRGWQDEDEARKARVGA